MSYDNRLELAISIDNSQANAAIGQVNHGFESIEKQAVQMASVASRAHMEMGSAAAAHREQVTEASHAVHLLGREIGLELPRAVRRFIGESELLGKVLSSAFNFSVYIAIGQSLFSFVKEIGEKFKWWGESAEEAAKKNDSLTKSIHDQLKELDDYGNKLDQIKKQRDLIGLTGSTKELKSVEQLQSDVSLAKTAYESAQARQNRLALNLMSPEYKIVNGVRQLGGKSIEDAKEYEKVQELTIKTEGEYNEALETLKNATKQLAVTRKDESEEKHKLYTKQFEEMNRYAKEYEKGLERIQSLDNETIQARMQTNAKAEAGLSAATGVAGWVKPTSAQDQIDAGLAKNEAFGKSIIDKAKATADLIKGNESLYESLARQQKDYSGMLAAELAQLDELKAKYADNADAITAIEERKKLLIERTNYDITQDAKSKFEKSAQSIEGFFNRVFLTAKSFSDVMHQLWTQIAGYAISQISKMVAAWFIGQRSMAGGSAGGSIIGAAAGTLPAFSAAAMSGGGNANALGGSWGSSGGGLGSLAGIGTGAIGLSSLALPVVGGLAMAGGLTSNMGAKGGLYAATGLAGISAAGAAGIGGGTIAGLAASLSIPIIGGIIAAGIGIGMLVGWLHKSATEKARQKIKSTYGVDIQSKGVLQQVVELAKQNYGGNLDMAVHSQQVAELVRLYAMTTGQATSGMRSPMSSATFSQSGGSLSYVPSYSNGLPGSGLNGSSIGGSSTTTIIQLDGTATTKLLRGEAVNAIAQNPRAVQSATYKASQGNYGRRQLAALQLAPGSIVS